MLNNYRMSCWSVFAFASVRQSSAFSPTCNNNEANKCVAAVYSFETHLVEHPAPHCNFHIASVQVPACMPHELAQSSVAETCAHPKPRKTIDPCAFVSISAHPQLLVGRVPGLCWCGLHSHLEGHLDSHLIPKRHCLFQNGLLLRRSGQDPCR